MDFIMLFREPFLLNALLGGLGIALISGPLGACIVWKRMAFFGDALSHAALFGIALSLWIDANPILGVIGIGILLALFLLWRQKDRKLSTDTSLAIASSGSLSLGLVAFSLVANLSQKSIGIMDYLLGDLLSIQAGELYTLFGIVLVSLGVLYVLWRPLLAVILDEDVARVEGLPVFWIRLAFMFLTVVTVAIAIKMVGVLLVTALLIIPAAIAQNIARSPGAMGMVASGIGGFAVLLGLQSSIWWDVPPGPMIVTVALGMFVVSSAVRVKT